MGADTRLRRSGAAKAFALRFGIGSMVREHRLLAWGAGSLAPAVSSVWAWASEGVLGSLSPQLYHTYTHVGQRRYGVAVCPSSIPTMTVHCYPSSECSVRGPLLSLIRYVSAVRRLCLRGRLGRDYHQRQSSLGYFVRGHLHALLPHDQRSLSWSTMAAFARAAKYRQHLHADA